MMQALFAFWTPTINSISDNLPHPLLAMCVCFLKAVVFTYAGRSLYEWIREYVSMTGLAQAISVTYVNPILTVRTPGLLKTESKL
jgi:hypothetical protein